MKIKKIILEKWIDPALITHHLTKKFGEKGLAWLDSDGKENGEWSIIGIKPKKIIQSRDINNLDTTNNPFNNLRNIEKGFWICLLYTSPSPRDRQKSRMPSSA